MKLGMDKELKAHFGQIRSGADPGRGQNRLLGAFLKNFLFRVGLQQQTEHKGMI